MPPEYAGWLGEGTGLLYDGRYGCDYILVRSEVLLEVRGMMENFTGVNQRGA